MAEGVIAEVAEEVKSKVLNAIAAYRKVFNEKDEDENNKDTHSKNIEKYFPASR
ncbi:MAG: hypothetical protein AB2689_21695 [Candidatus Thiodiazotropha taylori]